MGPIRMMQVELGVDDGVDIVVAPAVGDGRFGVVARGGRAVGGGGMSLGVVAVADGVVD
jgi:hypothetical protein